MGSSSEEQKLLGVLINQQALPHNFENGPGRESSYLSITATKLPFSSAELLEQSWWKVLNEKYFRHSTEWTVILIAVYKVSWIVGVL